MSELLTLGIGIDVHAEESNLPAVENENLLHNSNDSNDSNDFNTSNDFNASNNSRSNLPMESGEIGIAQKLDRSEENVMIGRTSHQASRVVVPSAVGDNGSSVALSLHNRNGIEGKKRKLESSGVQIPHSSSESLKSESSFAGTEKESEETHHPIHRHCSSDVTSTCGEVVMDQRRNDCRYSTVDREEDQLAHTIRWTRKPIVNMDIDVAAKSTGDGSFSESSTSSPENAPYVSLNFHLDCLHVGGQYRMLSTVLQSPYVDVTITNLLDDTVFFKSEQSRFDDEYEFLDALDFLSMFVPLSSENEGEIFTSPSSIAAPTSDAVVGRRFVLVGSEDSDTPIVGTVIQKQGSFVIFRYDNDALGESEIYSDDEFAVSFSLMDQRTGNMPL